MAYNKNNFSYARGSNSSKPQSYAYNPNYKPQKQFTKKSGCKLHKYDFESKEIVFFMTGWKVTKGEMLVFKATSFISDKNRTHITRSTKAESKKMDWINVFVVISNKTTFSEIKTSGMYCINTGKLYIKQFNLIANPKAPNGGYFGKHLSKKY